MMTDRSIIPIISVTDIQPVTTVGGTIYPLLTPKSAASTTGNMGLVRLKPGEWNAEHIHPHSEEYVIVLQGTLVFRIDDVPHSLQPQQGLIVPINARHRLANEGELEAIVVYTLAPLPPPGELMQIFTEALPSGAAADDGVY
jgi:putative monooxygenase